jgi:hypothetical protein
MKVNMAKELAALDRLTVTQLRQKHIEVFGEQTRSGNKDWLRKRIAWRMQANTWGDLSERARQRAEELANDADLRTNAPKAKPDNGQVAITTTATVAFGHGVEKVDVLLEAFPRTTLDDVCRDRDCRPSHLGRQSEQFRTRKIAGGPIHLHRQAVRQIKCLQLPVVSHGG